MSIGQATITRTFDIDLGHRLLKHEGKCRNLHGHRYVFEVEVIGPDLDDVGRLIDFGVIKSAIGGWLEDVFDHGCVLQKGDPLIGPLVVAESKLVVVDVPPSIENLVKIVFEGACEALRAAGAEHIKPVRVRGYETAKCYADYRGPT